MKAEKHFKSWPERRLFCSTSDEISPVFLDEPKGISHEGVSRSLHFMARHYDRPIQLRDLVAVSGMSRRGFIKAFSQHVGQPPGSFIRQARIEFAKRLLVEKDLPLKTLAVITGFRSENTFCIAFRRATGIAPKKYQRQVLLSACSAGGFLGGKRKAIFADL